jgi:hypothetical protein
MADQRDLHDIKQVVPAAFDAIIRSGRSLKGALRRGESPGETVPAVRELKEGECYGVIVTDSLSGGLNFRRTCLLAA